MTFRYQVSWYRCLSIGQRPNHEETRMLRLLVHGGGPASISLVREEGY